MLWGCLGTLAPRSSFKIPWVSLPMNSKGRKKTIPVWFFHCLQFHAIPFSSSARIRVRQEMGHRVNNGKQRTTLFWKAPLYKNKLAQVSDTGLKVVIVMIRLKRAKYQTPIKSFSFWACVLVAWCSLFKWCGFNLPACCEFQWRYSLAPPEFIKLSRRRRVHILHIWHTRSPYQSRSLSI